MDKAWSGMVVRQLLPQSFSEDFCSVYLFSGAPADAQGARMKICSRLQGGRRGPCWILAFGRLSLACLRLLLEVG